MERPGGCDQYLSAGISLRSRSVMPWRARRRTRYMMVPRMRQRIVMAMLPILQREVVENKGWATDEELTDYFAIGQCTPGVIAVNTATFIGQKRAGIAGGIVATLGVVFPSLLIIVALAGVITSFSHLTWVQHAFAGIRVCVCVLIFNAVLKLWKSAVKDVWGLLIFLAVLAASLLTSLSPVWYVLAAGVAGVLIQNLKGAKK